MSPHLINAYRPMYLAVAAIAVCFMLGAAFVKAEQEFKRQDLAMQETNGHE